MKNDYKFLETRAAKQNHRRSRPARHHLAIAAVAAVVGGLLIGLTPDNADAMRGQSVNNISSYNPANSVSYEIPLPTIKPAPAHPSEAISGNKTVNPAATSLKGKWHHVTVASGDSLALIFDELGLPAADVLKVMASGKQARTLRSLHPGQKMRLLVDAGQLQKLVLDIDRLQQLTITRRQDSFQASLLKREYERRITHTTAIIKHSLFGAGHKAGLSDNKTMDLAGIFGWDIDFALDIRAGDRFTIVYEKLYLKGKYVGEGRILAAEFTNQGKTFRSIRYTDPTGYSDFYTPDGHSMRKAFLRTPVAFSRISSRFSRGRRHPILNRIRAHKGVDYAARRGTPVKATGNGKIIFRGRKGGYGKVVIIRHGHRRTTLYGHLNNFNRKARLGSRVRQGQVIGYVGMTGLATGPHLHYEFRVDGVHRNPLTVKLPQAAPLPRKYRADFRRKTAPLLSQLELLRRNLVANNR
jgi:murein DD-endopeptidase MepM/ murein hydrolase activator NlpD